MFDNNQQPDFQKDEPLIVDEDTFSGAPEVNGDYVHIRVQKRNGEKCLTTVEGLKKELNYESILKQFKKEFGCNGNIVTKDKEVSRVIQLQGDQRKNTRYFIVKAGVADRDYIKLHGF
ncbi:hypothetical protein MKW98_029354 [Papaver atlanticum]|uniref:SUI1 domain-containing protein n=1 Tax=Papaver atlanticum TaxID=357466 RepID=A0AAD4XFS0_9MAGN|nr:hypothetical protein MKW98_029354 [Papaver atlanticum]